jgi:hypothetical protein
VLRKIFGHKPEKLSGNWRKLLEEELHDFSSSSSILRLIK